VGSDQASAADSSLDSFLARGQVALGPNRGGRILIYRRLRRPPPRHDVFAGRSVGGCDAIEVSGSTTRVYYDMFTNYVSSRLPVPLDLEEEPELLDALIGSPGETLETARGHVDPALWKQTTSSIIHVVAIDPALTIVTDDVRLAAEQRIGSRIEFVPFLTA
jgi:hypothetical protein